MNNPKLYICYASSDYYARETGVSLLGFLDNNPDYEPEEIFILDYGILPQNKEKLDGIASAKGKRINYLPAKAILEKIQEKCNLSNFRGSLATYSRAFIDKIMPEYVDRLLYIDSDTVVVGSVSELENFDMDNSVMAGCVAELFSDEIHRGHIKLYTGNSWYINCGIVLFDLSNWRKFNCFERISDVLKIKKRYPCADQTLINNALPQAMLKRMPRKFNYTFHTYHPKQEPFWMSIGGVNNKNEINEAIDKPVIIHYPGSPVNRPWYEGCLSRRANDYYRYKSQSPWKDDKLYSLDEYKNSLEGFSRKFGYFIHQQEIHRSSYGLVRNLTLIRNAMGRFIRKILNQTLPSEGKENCDKTMGKLPSTN